MLANRTPGNAGAKRFASKLAPTKTLRHLVRPRTIEKAGHLPGFFMLLKDQPFSPWTVLPFTLPSLSMIWYSLPSDSC